jgi:hydrogenase/urease accessory protein HupE
MHHLSALGDSSKAAWAGGFQWSFWISLSFCAIGVAATLLVIKRVAVPEAEPTLAVDY